MKMSRFINMSGAVLTIAFILFRITYPGYISEWFWLGMLTILCIMMVYKTNLNWINIIGLLVALMLGILYTLYEEDMKSIFSGVPGLIFIILLSVAIMYRRRKPKKKDINEE